MQNLPFWESTMEQFIDTKDFLGNYNKVKDFRHTLTTESDRGCALMAAAYLDSQLEILLRLCFVENLKVADNMVDQSKPLGTFSARIDVLYLLGKIGPSAHHDLHLIRKIRNDFGHNPTPIGFEHGPIAARCRELAHCVHQVCYPGRHEFTATTMTVLAIIHSAIKYEQHPAEEVDKFYDVAEIEKDATEIAEVLGIPIEMRPQNKHTPPSV